jgi:hypothetical protein
MEGCVPSHDTWCSGTEKIDRKAKIVNNLIMHDVRLQKVCHCIEAEKK